LQFKDQTTLEELASVLQYFYREKHLAESVSLSIDLNAINEGAKPLLRDVLMIDARRIRLGCAAHRYRGEVVGPKITGDRSRSRRRRWARRQMPLGMGLVL